MRKVIKIFKLYNKKKLLEQLANSEPLLRFLYENNIKAELPPAYFLKKREIFFIYIFGYVLKKKIFITLTKFVMMREDLKKSELPRKETDGSTKFYVWQPCLNSMFKEDIQ